MVSRHTTIPLAGWLGMIAALLLFSTPLLADTELVVDYSLNNPPVDGGTLPLFWNGSGFNPGDRDNARFQDAAQHQNMLYLGSVPHDGVRYQRPHYLLDLVGLDTIDPTESPTYDWTRLDAFVDIVVASRQALFFQLMGNPGGLFDDFTDHDQLVSWKRLVQDLAKHLESRYGEDEVQLWFFETWNEPDGDFGWTWNTDEEFYNYYDACSEGLLAADLNVPLGGPGVANLEAGLLKGLIDHSIYGRNYFTGETGVRLDFISYHHKRLPAQQVDEEISELEEINNAYPLPADTLFVNNESDAECCWWQEYKEFRATAWYAAFIARQVNEHLVRMINGMNLNYRLANDNAFLGSWPQRTHLTRFGDNDSSFALIKKPAHNVMTLLSLLGDRQASFSGFSINDRVGALASLRGAEQAAILVYHYDDDSTASAVETVSLAINNLPFATGKVAHYRIDQSHGDTYVLWQALNSPELPDASQLATLRDAQELALLEPVADLTASDLTLNFDLPLPGVSLILLSADPGTAPPGVSDVAAERFPSLTAGKEDVVVSWKPTSRFVRTYEVLHSPTGSGEPFQRINTPDLIATAFLHPIDKDATAYFKVRAIDYWGRPGPESDVVESRPTPITTFIVDNTDAGFEPVGDWRSSTFIPGFHGGDYLHDRNLDQGTKSARWTPDLPVAGNYDVAIWYPSDARKADNVPVTITHQDGAQNLFLNQNENGSTWVWLGRFSFGAGTGGYVEISNTNTNNYVVADAVRFIYVPDLEVEAESGTLSLPMEIIYDASASGGQAISAPPGNTSMSSPPSSGHAVYTFDVQTAGTYRIKGSVIAPDTAHDSFWVKMDSESWIKWNHIPLGTSWHMAYVHDDDNDRRVVEYDLSIATHTLTIAYREGGTKLDTIALELVQEPQPCKADFNDDGKVDEEDLEAFSIAMGEINCAWLPELCDCDIDGYDNDIDGADLSVLTREFGRTDCP